MKLTEAIASGKKFARKADADLGDFFTAEQYLDEAIGIEGFNANDYVLEPVINMVISTKILSAAWNDSKGGSDQVKIASASPMFARLIGKLKTQGVKVVD